MTLSDGMKLTAKDIRDVLEAGVKAGANPAALKQLGLTPDIAGKTGWNAIARKSWEESRAVAGMLGGPRLKFQVPFTSFRYISSPLAPMARFTPHAIGSEVMSFFAGKSATKGIMHEIALGNAPWDMLVEHNTNGFRSIEKLVTDNPNHAYAKAFNNLVSSRGRQFSSMMYPLSDSVGTLTAHFDKQAASARRGLPGFLSYRASVDARTNEARFSESLFARSLKEDTELGAAFEQIGISVDPAKHTIDPERLVDVARAIEAFPDGVINNEFLQNPAAIEAWYRDTHPAMGALEKLPTQGRTLPGQGSIGVRGEDLPDLTEREVAALERHHTNLAETQRIATTFTAEEHQVFEKYRVYEKTARAEANKNGATIGSVAQTLEAQNGIHSSQIPDWQATEGMHAITRADAQYIWASDYSARDWKEIQLHGPSADVRPREGADFAGVRVHTQRQSMDDIRVATRGSEYIQMDETGNFKMPGGVLNEEKDAGRTALDVRAQATAKVDEVEQKLNAHIDRNERTMTTATGGPRPKPEGTLSALEKQNKVAEMMSLAAQADRPGSYGVYTREGEDIVQTVWNPRDVKVVNDFDFPAAGESLGFYHRTLNTDAMSWSLGGEG